MNAGKMFNSKMFDSRILDNLLDRMLKELEESGQFDRLTKEGDHIRVHTEDSRVYIRVSLQWTYSDKRVFASADGLRIRFKSSLFNNQLRTYMVPKWSGPEETWTFSRSKLLTKTANAIQRVSALQQKIKEETQRREVFARFIGKELGFLQEQGLVKVAHHYDRQSGSVKKIVQIELPNVHIDLCSPNNGELFRIECIKPMAGKYETRLFDAKAIKELITRLEEIFTPEGELVLQQ